MKPHEHLGVTELAAHMNVSRTRLYQLRDTYPDFPQPAARLSRGDIWHTTDIDAWIAKHPDRHAGTRVTRP